MNQHDDELLDEFLREAMETGTTSDQLGAVGALLTPREPPPDLRLRVMRSTERGRLVRFASRVAQLLDVTAERAAEMLDLVDCAESWQAGPGPGVTLHHVVGGAAVRGAITGFVRVARGEQFPVHRHLGAERVLVVQGAFRDEPGGRIVRAGDTAEMAAGTSHALVVLPGPALVYVAVVFDGVDIGGTLLRPDDPRI